jgi:cobalt-zinc-cadmium efflux system protein
MPHQHDQPHSHAKDSHAGHSHAGHSHAPATYDRAFLVGLLLNGGFVLTEFGFGLQANSVALMADAGHNLSDVLGLLLAWTASTLARRQPSARYTYGWRKISVLAAFLNAVFLMLVTGGIISETVQRLFHPDDVKTPIVIVVAAVGIAINTGTALMFLSGRKGDMNIRAAFQHMAMDALVSLGVVLAGVTIFFTHWLWLDPAFSLAISAFIIFSTWELLKDSFHLAIDGVPEHIDERAIRQYLCEHSQVAAIHDLHIWSMSTVETALTAHLVMPDGHPGDEFLVRVSQDLRDRFRIQHVTLQIELNDSPHSCLMETSCQRFQV